MGINVRKNLQKRHGERGTGKEKKVRIPGKEKGGERYWERSDPGASPDWWER